MNDMLNLAKAIQIVGMAQLECVCEWHSSPVVHFMDRVLGRLKDRMQEEFDPYFFGKDTEGNWLS